MGIQRSPAHSGSRLESRFFWRGCWIGCLAAVGMGVSSAFSIGVWSVFKSMRSGVLPWAWALGLRLKSGGAAFRKVFTGIAARAKTGFCRDSSWFSFGLCLVFVWAAQPLTCLAAGSSRVFKRSGVTRGRHQKPLMGQATASCFTQAKPQDLSTKPRAPAVQADLPARFCQKNSAEVGTNAGFAAFPTHNTRALSLDPTLPLKGHAE